MQTKTTTDPRAGSAQAARAAALPVVFAALLGVFLVWGVGFSQISAVHNAGHDTRHAAPFPCH